jgi:hypothetical protein
MLWRALIGTVLIILAVMIVIHSLCLLLGLMLGTFSVKPIFAFGLSKLVNFSSGKSDKELFGELMVNWFTCTT